MYLSLPGAGPHSLVDHNQILNLLGAGAYEEAKRYLKTHIDRTFELLMATMKENNIKD
jgi:DNA-binding GntR family transcriptional regulator